MNIEAGTRPRRWYETTCTEQGIKADAAQAAAVEELDVLWLKLIEFKARRNQFLGRSLLSPKVPMGLYLWGGVGRGKTFLMDGFFECLPYRRKRRVHFHSFMAEIHTGMKRLSGHPNPLLAVADDIVKSTRVLCLDEFHIDDIADAMIMGRLLKALFERGVILLTTSNYPPDELYPNGLQRELFLPAIALVRENLNLVQIDGSLDYRLLKMARESLFLVPHNRHNEQRMSHLFTQLTHEAPAPARLHLKHRHLNALAHVKDVVWFDFNVLCGGNHDSAEYLEVAVMCSTVFLSNIPRLGPDNGAETRRFTWLVDVLYDNRIKLVATAAMLPNALYQDVNASNDYLRTASRLTEMQTRRYLESMGE
jgi:cell division protein ZapE